MHRTLTTLLFALLVNSAFAFSAEVSPFLRIDLSNGMLEGAGLQGYTAIGLASTFDASMAENNVELSVKADGALYLDQSLQLAVKELYARAQYSGLSLVMGRKVVLPSPWNLSRAGQIGQDGLFLEYSPGIDLVAGLRLALEGYFLDPEEVYLGVRAGVLRGGGIFSREVSQDYDPDLGDFPIYWVAVPRVSLEGDGFSIGWQGDKGYFAMVSKHFGFADLSGNLWFQPDERLVFGLDAKLSKEILVGLDVSVEPLMAFRIWSEFYLPY